MPNKPFIIAFHSRGLSLLPFIIAFHCLSLLPFIAFHYCLSLPFIAFHCLSLPFIALHCLSLPFIALHCLSLPGAYRNTPRHSASVLLRQGRVRGRVSLGHPSMAAAGLRMILN